jgi:NAD(P)-dependent dehydrogenase (short-subunit alcohol dehydrogenase family)
MWRPRRATADAGRAGFEPGDITSDDDWIQVVERARAESGGVDVLVHNSAIYQGLATKRALTELSTDDWDNVL